MIFKGHYLCTSKWWSFFVGKEAADMKDKKNPQSGKERKGAEAELETDVFTVEEQAEIVDMIKKDIISDQNARTEWMEWRRKDIQMYDGERPSLIENLSKEPWMSDRNLGLTAANCDAYQATLVSTCYNIDTIHFKATEENDKDYKEQISKFTKWGLGRKEANFYPEVDDFIANKVQQGISYFYIHWDVWYEWVDRRIPKFDVDGNLIKYDIKTEHKRFEKGVIENISDVSDLLYPKHGNNLQKKSHLIHRVRKTAKEIIDFGKRGIFVNVNEDYVKTLKKYLFDNRVDLLDDEKGKQLGIDNEDKFTDNDLRLFPIEIYNWYGKFERKGKYEEYRFTIHAETSKFLAGKPLRKITRSGKRPFVGSPFIRRPGYVQGTSLPRLIADPVNAFNNTYNQKSDFQYVENCPFFFYSPDERNKKQQHKIRPGTGIPTDNPESINFPNLTRSLAWATTDFQLFFEIIEKLTGAASYFMSNSKGVSGTATRDAIINEKSDTRFSLWVNRIVSDINEAVTMWLEMYQDWAPPDLGERVLGDDGKKLFPNFSIETIRGGYDAVMTPDIISGSKTLQKEIAIWSLEALSMTPWLSPQMNPKGNWNLVVNTAKKVGFEDVESYMPPEPKAQFMDAKPIADKWTQLKQGQMPEVEEGDDILELFMGFSQIAEEKRNELDKEYLPNLDVFMLKLNVMMQKEMQRVATEQQSNQMAMKLINDVDSGRIKKEDVVNG